MSLLDGVRNARRRSRSTAGAIAVTLLLAVTAAAQSDVPVGWNTADDRQPQPPIGRSAEDAPSRPDEARGDGSDELARKRYAARQRATLELWRQRDLSREEVQRAARDPDPEVAGRANWILRQWRRGALPGVPAEVSRRLNDASDPAAIRELLEIGQFEAAVVAVEESIATIERESVQRQVSAILTRRFPVLIKRAIETDSLAALLRLIDISADSKEMAVCRVQMIEQLGLNVDQLGLLPTAAETWSQQARQDAEVLVLVVLGRLDDALETARASGDQRLLGICRMIAGSWREMASENAELAAAAEAGSHEQARYWSQALIAADRSQQRDIYHQAVEALSQFDPSRQRTAAELAWKTLAGHGEIEPAVAMVRPYRPDAAAEVAMAAGRGALAFEILGLPLPDLRHGDKLRAWVDAALTSQHGVAKLTTETRSALAMIRCLLTVGMDDEAKAVVDQMCQSYVEVDGIPIREYVLSTLTMTQHRDWVIEVAGQAGEDSFTAITQSTVAGTISGADRLSVEILMDAVGTLKPTLTFAQRLRMVHQLLAGETAPGFDPGLDFKRLFDQLAAGKREIQQLRGRPVVSPRVRLSLSVARVFSINGRADLAAHCLRYLVDSYDVEATLEHAEREMDSGGAEAAGELFATVWERVESNGHSGRYRPAVDDVDYAAKALVGQWTLARRGGDDQLADQLYRQLILTCCTPSTETRSALAGYLGDRGELPLAMQIYESLLPMAAFGTPGTTALYQVAWKQMRLATDTEIDDAVRWYDLAASGTLESTDYYRSDAYLTLPLDVRRFALEAAIARGDREAAQRHLERIFKLDPLDIDTGERLLPKLREAGMRSLADDAMAQLFDRGLEYLEQFPLDATSCNNLAWSAAMNDYRLDQSLELSMRAVLLEPDSAIFRDTLAEILFRLGHVRQALQVEESCVLDDPSQWHLHVQIEKYRRAVQETEAVDLP